MLPQAGFYHGFGLAPAVCPLSASFGDFLTVLAGFLPGGGRPSWRSRVSARSFSSLTCSSSVMGADERSGGMSCTAGYSYGFAGRSGIPAGKPIPEGNLSIIGPGEQPASPMAKPKPAADKVRWNTCAILRKTADKPETGGDSMNYTITLYRTNMAAPRLSFR
jgi:hypothetical protein